MRKIAGLSCGIGVIAIGSWLIGFLGYGPALPFFGGSTDLPVYPAAAKSLAPISLTDLIFLALPQSGKPTGWDQMLDAPVHWLTDGYTFLPNGGAERLGIARVRISGVMSTMLGQVREELAWTVTLSAQPPAKFGPDQITIEPGVPPDDGCFGELFSGCTFSTEQATISTKFQSQLLCGPLYGSGDQVFKISASGRVSSLLRYVMNSGSGGENNWVEIRPLSDESMLCSGSPVGSALH